MTLFLEQSQQIKIICTHQESKHIWSELSKRKHMHVYTYVHITFIYMTFASAFMSMDIHVLTPLIEIVLGLVGFNAYSQSLIPSV